MKKVNIYFSLLILLTGLFSCRDESLNPIPTTEFKDGVTFTAVGTSPAFLDLANFTGSKLEFTTDTKRPDLISKVDVWAELVPASGTKISKYFKTLPQLVGTNSYLFSDMLSALSLSASDLKPGDIIKAKFVATTPDGRTFSEDNTVGTLPSSGSSAFTRSINTTVACVFNASQFSTGKWTVAVDEWNDYKVGEEITVKPGPGANDLTLGIYATTINHKDIVITVSNLNTGAITVAKQAYGMYVGDPDTYSAEGTGSLSGCAGTINLSLKHTSPNYTSPFLKFNLVRK